VLFAACFFAVDTVFAPHRTPAPPARTHVLFAVFRIFVVLRARTNEIMFGIKNDHENETSDQFYRTMANVR
jgi:hypothetical protein